ncbi:hypothetical protein HN011_000743, partial [Eciton burchellii]
SKIPERRAIDSHDEKQVFSLVKVQHYPKALELNRRSTRLAGKRTRAHGMPTPDISDVEGHCKDENTTQHPSWETSGRANANSINHPEQQKRA